MKLKNYEAYESTVFPLLNNEEVLKCKVTINDDEDGNRKVNVDYFKTVKGIIYCKRHNNNQFFVIKRDRKPKEEYVKSPCKSNNTIGCRGKKCKKIHTFINKLPTEFTCECGYVIAKDGFIYPTQEVDNENL